MKKSILVFWAIVCLLPIQRRFKNFNRVGLSKEVNKKVYQLSGGEQQRVALARLMMKKCSVVLADEPTGSLDKKNRDIVMRLLHELNEEGKTVIIVTHDQGIIEDEPYVVKI